MNEKPDKFFESNAGDGTTVYEHQLTGVPLYVCFVSLFIILFLIGLDQTIVVTLYNKIGNEFQDFNNIGWIMSSYMLAICVVSAIWGRLSIVYGRKWSLLAAIALFEAGSLMCALSKNMNTLIGGRVLSGVGAGGVQTLVFVVGTEIVSIDQRPQVFTILSIAFGISSIVGPLIGGGFTTNVTWRWAFYLNLPCGGLCVILLLVFFHPPNPKFTWKQKILSVDYFGAFLQASSFTLFLLALAFGGNEYPWRSGAVISMFILSGLILIAFVVYNAKWCKHPTIPHQLLIIPTVDATLLCTMLCFLGLIGSDMMLSNYFQIIHGNDALHTGLHLLPMIVGSMVSAILVTILLQTTRMVKLWAVVGGVIFAVGMGLLCLLDEHSSSSRQIGLLILPGFALSFLLQTILMSAQLDAPKEEGSTIMITTMINWARSMGGAIGANLCQTIFNTSVKNKLTSLFNSTPDVFGTITIKQIESIQSEPDTISTFPDTVQKVVYNVIMSSIRNVFYTLTAVACVCFILCCFFSNKRIPKVDEVMRKEDVEENKSEADVGHESTGEQGQILADA